MQNVYSVGRLNAYIKNMFLQDFVLKRISVRGEVSNLKYHPSGHIYFTLKDSAGAIACVMFASARAGLAFRMENGRQVVVTGSVDVYEKAGSYQLYAREIRQEGTGLLYEKFEATKRELEEMGMFAGEYKQPIPLYVRTLGIVTAPSGAAIRDIMNIAGRRNPFVQLILCPAQVQGEGAADSIAQAIERLDAYGADVIIVGRGGGSIEDLWAFNEVKVARAIFGCRTPVISAVGHETDTTIADFVADLRAPTPSAAAELAVQDVRLIFERLRLYDERMTERMNGALDERRQRLKSFRQLVEKGSPENQIREKRQMLLSLEEKLERGTWDQVRLSRLRADGLAKRMENRIGQTLMQTRHRLLLDAERMKGLSPLEKLSQGYAWLTDEEGRRISEVSQTRPGARIRLDVRDGEILADVTEVRKREEPWTKKS